MSERTQKAFNIPTALRFYLFGSVPEQILENLLTSQATERERENTPRISQSSVLVAWHVYVSLSAHALVFGPVCNSHLSPCLPVCSLSRPQVNCMKTQKPPAAIGDHRRTKWIEEGREQVRESEREGRQEGLAANPVHGQSRRSLIFLSRWCRQNNRWITPPYFIALFKKESPSFFRRTDGLKVWLLACRGTREQRTKKQGGRPVDRMSRGQCGATHG